MPNFSEGRVEYPRAPIPVGNHLVVRLWRWRRLVACNEQQASQREDSVHRASVNRDMTAFARERYIDSMRVLRVAISYQGMIRVAKV